MSVVLWHGVPGCGKSTAMREYVTTTTASSGAPAIIVDPARVTQWADIPHVDSVKDVVTATWGAGKHVACTPSKEDLERICAACRAGKDVLLVIDEVRPYASAYTAGDELVILARQHRWARCDLLLGTQNIADVRSDLLTAVDTLHTGRVSAPNVLAKLRAEYGLDPEKVATLERGQWITTKMGF